MKNRNKPDQISNTISRGGKSLDHPMITETLVGMVAPCMRTIPIQPPISASRFIMVRIIRQPAADVNPPNAFF